MNKNKTASLLGAVGALALLLTAWAGPAYAQRRPPESWWSRPG